MSLPDLDRKCGECGGAGMISAPAWSDWWARWREAEEQAPGLGAGAGPDARRARADEIAGPAPEGPEEILCGVCGGRQRVPTEDGERLLAFFSRHQESVVA